MAFLTFKIYPSTDIHLILDAAFRNLQLEVIAFNDQNPSPFNITGAAQTRYSIADSSIASVSANGTLTALVEGITFMMVEYNPPGTSDIFSLVARVWVHTGFHSITLGNNSGTVNVNSDNFIPTLYARFNNDDFEDVTSHPYVSYQSSDTSIFTVDQAIGRISGLSVGQANLRIFDNLNSTAVGDLPIHVEPALNSPREIVEKIGFKGIDSQKRNVLFIAEGFQQNEKAKFTRIVKAIDRGMRKFHQPFKLLNDDYNTWMVFDPSAENGISIGALMSLKANGDYETYFDNVHPLNATNYSLYQLIEIVGMPTEFQRNPNNFNIGNATSSWAAIAGFTPSKLEPRIFDAWQSNYYYRTKCRNSKYGMALENRLGDRWADVNLKKNDASWFKPNLKESKQPWIVKDSRRVSSNYFSTDFNSSPSAKPLIWLKEMSDYLGSLKLKGLPSSQSGYNIGDKWTYQGDDEGLVIMIINDHMFGANVLLYDTPALLCSLSIGGNNNIMPASSTTTTFIDNVAITLLDHSPIINRYNIQEVVSRSLHELVHTIYLGDEYENIRKNQNKNKLPNSNRIEIGVDMFWNLASEYAVELKLPGGQPTLKWGFVYPRIEKSSAILNAQNGIGTTIELDLYDSEIDKWTAGDNDIFLITRNLNFPLFADPTLYNNKLRGIYPSRMDHMFGVIPNLSFQSKSGNRLTLAGGTIQSGQSFPKGSMILIQKQNNQNTELYLIHPNVKNFMENGTSLLTKRPLSTRESHLLSILNDPKKLAILWYINRDKFTTQTSLRNTIQNNPNNCEITIPGYYLPPTRVVPGLTINRHSTSIGLHEGGSEFNCGVYRPSATCKMKIEYFTGHIRFCHVCKYSIVQDFNPSKHAELDKQYPGK